MRSTRRGGGARSCSASAPGRRRQPLRQRPRGRRCPPASSGSRCLASAIHRGPAIIELVNYGEDDHDLALRRVGGTRTYRIALVHPGKTGELDARLRAGRYAVWCTLADHRARGMRATLLVR